MANLNDQLGILRDAMDELTKQGDEFRTALAQYRLALARFKAAESGMAMAQEKFNRAVAEVRKVRWTVSEEKVAEDATQPPHGV